jgi:hypothetical protein
MRQTVGLFKVMRGKQDCQSKVGVELPDVFPQHLPAPDVEPQSGFIQEQDLRSVYQCGRNIEFASYSARICADNVVELPGQFEIFG